MRFGSTVALRDEDVAQRIRRRQVSRVPAVHPVAESDRSPSYAQSWSVLAVTDYHLITFHFHDIAFSKAFAWKLGLALGCHSRIVRSLPFTLPLVCSWAILPLKCFTKLTCYSQSNYYQRFSTELQSTLTIMLSVKFSRGN